MKLRAGSICVGLAAVLLAGVSSTVPRAHAVPGAADRRAAVVAGAVSALREHAAVVGFPGDRGGPQGLGRDQLVRAVDVMADPDGSTHVRMERTFRGRPVLGGDFVVHRGGDGGWSGVSAGFTRPLEQLVLTPVLNAAAVSRLVPRGSVLRGTPRLVIDARHGAPASAWDVESVGTQPDGTPSHRHTYVDARSGRILEAEELVETVAGTGHSYYDGDVALQTAAAGRGYALRDATRGGGGTVDAGNAADTCLPFGLCSPAPTQLFNNPSNDWGDGTLTNRQTVAVDAQYGSDMTWDFYRKVLGRSGVNDDGVGVNSRVHYGEHYANAFWSDDCACMTYGDGDGKELGPLVSLDVTGHEITHGVTARTAKLQSDGESGGLNESTSDIFGTMIEFYAANPADPGDYLIGAQAFLDQGRRRKAIRYLDRPSRDHLSPDCWDLQVAGLDPHLSAGIGNHFFYLLAEGSGRKRVNGISYDSPTCDGKRVDGIGRDAAAAIWYRALTHYFTSTTDYSAARQATIRAARDLYGPASVEASAVPTVWDAVGVDAPVGAPDDAHR
jgi:Zn-dependent metalloprotease